MLMSSSEKLTVRKEIARCSSDSGTSLLNSAPENFVVVEGQSFRVSRTSFDHSLVGGAGKAERGRGEDVVLRESSNGLALTNVVAKQTDELQRQALRIEELERFIASHSGSLPRAAVEAIMSSSSSSSSSSTATSGSGPRLGLAARRRAESLSKSSTALETVTTAVGESTPPADSFHDCGSSSPMSLLTVTTVLSALAPESDFVTPTSDAGDISLASNTPGSAVTGSGGGATGKSPPPRGLAARLAMGSQERRRLAAARRGGGDSGGSSGSAATTSSAKSSAGGFAGPHSPEEEEGNGVGRSSPPTSASPVDDENYDNALYDSSPVPPPPLDVTTWKWITRKSIGSSSPKARQKLHLFVAHDNPQVGNTVATQLRTEQGMRLMIESKEDGASSRTCIILATIVYSGPCEGVEQAHTRGQRGSQFIVCTDLKGFRADIKAFPTRTRGDILEIDLQAIDASCKIDFDDDEDRLKAFIQACTSRVDVILDPSCSSDSWYPYWEGRRKMAPQFRSRGIGYLRLGDDMSRYGTAFLSLDAGKTFLDDGATSIVEGEALKSSASSAALTYPPTLGLSPSLRMRAASAGAAHQHRGGSSSSSSSSASALRPHSSHPSVGAGDGAAGAGGAVADVQRARDQDELRDIVLFLRQGGGEGQQKWADRAERLGRLGQLVGCLSTSSAAAAAGSAHSSSGASPTASGMQLSEVISVLHETITRQNNPHVLRAAIGAVRCVGDCCNISMCGVAWRTLLLETMHLLRAPSKAVHDEAREALGMLHTRAKVLSLAHLQPMLEELLAGPRKGSASSHASSSRVVAWLTGLCKVEVDRMGRQLATAHSDAYKPSPFEKADTATTLARCRGLLTHREEATRDSAVELCVSVVLLDVLWSSPTVVALVSAAKQASSRLKKADSAGGAAAEAALLKGLSPACGSALAEVSKVAPRLYDKLVAAAIKGLSALANSVMTMHAAALAPSVAGVSPRASASASTDRAAAASAPPVPAQPQPQAKARGPSPPTASASAPALPSTPVEPNPKRPVLGKGVSQALGLGLPPRHPGLDLQAEAEADFGLEKTVRVGTPDGTDGTASTASTASSADDGSDGYSGRSMRASPRSRSSPPGAQAQAQAQAQAHPLQAALEGQWFEAKLVLRMVPNTESSWNVLTAVLSESGEFVAALTAAAKQCGIPRGTLLRSVLPFDESTSSNDQSNVRDNGSTINAPSVLSKLDASVLGSLRSRAVDLRRLLRVKMADEADLLQAAAAAELLKRFCKNVEAVAADSGVSAVAVVKSLI